MSESEIESINKKLERIIEILLGDGDEKQGLVAKVNQHENYINEQKKSKMTVRFDMFRAGLSLAVAILIAIASWTAGKVSKAIQSETTNTIQK